VPIPGDDPFLASRYAQENEAMGIGLGVLLGSVCGVAIFFALLAWMFASISS
jgi:hypothetical protein